MSCAFDHRDFKVVFDSAFNTPYNMTQRSCKYKASLVLNSYNKRYYQGNCGSSYFGSNRYLKK